ncbi:hypothetical protein V1477_004964 [Vespula maculifrons]|uniref:Uncharacterized protein n=1 Tax=Vespula maculifrons TaxID=7453 RepID=A0ABD2CPF8_VESMC
MLSQCTKAIRSLEPDARLVGVVVVDDNDDDDDDDDDDDGMAYQLVQTRYVCVEMPAGEVGSGGGGASIARQYDVTVENGVTGQATDGFTVLGHYDVTVQVWAMRIIVSNSREYFLIFLL